jgi:autotransporter translocation and assembly factor TamB
MSALDRRTEAILSETRRPRPVRRIFRVLGWTLLALVLLILAALAGAFGLLQTGWGKREIASLARGALSGEGKTAEITGIEGFLPFDMRIDRVRLGDPQGHWLEVDGARFHLVPSALLHRLRGRDRQEALERVFKRLRRGGE